MEWNTPFHWRMFGNRLQTTLAVEGPWKQFQGRNVQDLSEAAKLLYDVDIQINSKEAAYMVYDHKLRVITDMPATLEECSRLIRDMSFAKGPRDEEPWKIVAKERRRQLKETTTGRVQALKKAYLEAEMRFNDQYDNGNEELDEEQAARKTGEQEGLEYKYGTMERFEKELAKIARKKTDVFDEFEEGEAKGIMEEDGVPADDGKA